jgi:triacylglycerol esterase/lipase EstA (alpha/beta hydrolase family)
VTRPKWFRAAVVAAATLVAVSVTAIASPAGATPGPNKGATVILIHGFSASANDDCNSTFSPMISQMKGDGFTGNFITVGYYSGDTNCSVSLHNYGTYNDGDPFTNIGQALSSYVYNTFTKNGTTIDAVGYSMGGIILRAAVYGASIGASGYSSPINIGRAVTLGAPHNGAAWYAGACTIVGWTQCAAMAQGSSQLNWLNQNGNPQGSAGTYWTAFGSNDDDVVPSTSATYMTLPAAQKIVFDNVSHTGFIHPNYMNAWSVVNLAGDVLGHGSTAITSGVSSTKCIDDKGSGTNTGNPIQIWDCNGSGAQIWLHDSPGGKTTFSVLGLCMDDTSSGTSNGTKIQLYTCNNTGAQQWTPGANGSLQIFGKCLDDPGSSTTNGTQLQLYTCNGTNAQRWIYG